MKRLTAVFLFLVFFAGIAEADNYYVGQVITGLKGTGELGGQDVSVKVLGIVSGGPMASTYSLEVVLLDQEGNEVNEAIVEPGTDLKYVFFGSDGEAALETSLLINEINLVASPGIPETTPQQEVVQGEAQGVENQDDENAGIPDVQADENTQQNGNGPELLYCEDGAHQIWESWNVACNTCSCGNDGVITCTKINCNGGEQADENQAGQNNAGQQPAGTGIIESIMQFFQGLLKLIFV